MFRMFNLSLSEGQGRIVYPNAGQLITEDLHLYLPEEPEALSILEEMQKHRKPSEDMIKEAARRVRRLIKAMIKAGKTHVNNQIISAN